MANAAITVDLNARIAHFETELKRATGTLDRFEKKGSATLATFKSFGAGLTGALSVGAVTAFAKSGIDAADALNDMSQRTGVAVKTLAEYKLAATLADTSLDSLAKGIQRLTLSIGQAEAGGKTQAKALKELGINARDPQRAFEQLADAVARSNDPIKTSASLNDLLGRSYADLLPLLQGGSKGLRESAAASASFSDAMVMLAPEAAKLNDELDALKLGAAGFGAQVLAVTVGPLAEWIASTNILIDRHGVLLGVLSAVGAAAVPGVTATQLAGRVSVQAFRDQLAGAKKELAAIDAATKTGTFGLIQLALYGSEAEMRRKGEYLRSNVKTLEESIRQYQTRLSAGPTLNTGVLDPSKFLKVGAAAGGKGRRFDSAGLLAEDVAAGLREAGEELARYAESARFVEEADLERANAVNALRLEWIEAGRAIEEEFAPPLKKLEDRLGYLDELFRRGLLSVEAYGRANEAAFDSVGKLADKVGEADAFGKIFAENAQDIFADFFKNFDRGSDDILKKFGQTIKAMIAEAAAADLARVLFGDKIKGGSGSGKLGSIVDFFGSIFGGLRADGGPVSTGKAYVVGERGPELFMPRSSGTIVPNDVAVGRRGAGGLVVQQTIYSSGGNPKELSRAAGKGLRDAYAAMRVAERYV